MNKRKITELLDRLESGNHIGKTQSSAVATADIKPDDGKSGRLNEAAYRLGAAMLNKLHLPDEIDPEELVNAIISIWENQPDGEREAGDSAMLESPLYTPDVERNGASMPQMAADMMAGTAEGSFPTAKKRLPRPIRGGIGEAPQMDYQSMSAEQFRRLKKQLQRASMDGRRVRI